MKKEKKNPSNNGSVSPFFYCTAIVTVACRNCDKNITGEDIIFFLSFPISRIRKKTQLYICDFFRPSLYWTQYNVFTFAYTFQIVHTCSCLLMLREEK